MSSSLLQSEEEENNVNLIDDTNASATVTQQLPPPQPIATVETATDTSLMMLIGKLHSGVNGASPFYLQGTINGASTFMLVDPGSTHNIVSLNFARANRLQEFGISTLVLISNGREVPCHGASFNIPVQVDNSISSV